MVPIDDQPEERRRLFPVVMLALLLANVAVFGYQLSLPAVERQGFITTHGVTPASIVAATFGGEAQATTSVLPVYTTMLTAMFIHGDLLHLAGNMIFLWVFGDNVESTFGHLTFLGCYLAAGVAAFLAEIALTPLTNIPAIGASGAVAGVMACYLLLFPRAPVRVLLLGPIFTLGRTAALPLIGFWFGFQLVQGMGTLSATAPGAGGVAYFAHVGGFLFGLAFTGAVLALRHEALGRFIPLAWWDRNLRNAALVVGATLAALTLTPLLDPPSASLARLGIVAGSAALALSDGLLRATGRPGPLGEGRGMAKALAIIQVLTALGVLVGLFAV